MGDAIGIDDTAENINTFFAEIGPKLAERHDLEWEFMGTQM